MGMFSSPEVEEATSPRAWLQAMLDVEGALARAHGAAGAMPAAAVASIVAACDAGLYEIAAMREGAVASASPVVPLVEALRTKAGPEAARYVHLGATSQDIIDTAMMLLARRCTNAILAEIDRAAATLAGLAREHRGTLMLARTLLQPALPTSFGLKCAGWLDGWLDARDALERVRSGRLAVQFGGAAGTLASLGADGPRLVELLAGELGLAAPPVPWQTSRGRMVELASALSMAAGAAGKVAGDILLLAQAEVGEVTAAAPAGGGRSSAMPHKRNPAAAVLAVAASKQASGYASMLIGLQVHEHERGAGSWQAEWQPLTLLLNAAGGAVHHVASLLKHVAVHPQAMRANLDAQRGLPMAESLSARLSRHLAGTQARDLVEELCVRVGASDSTLLEEATRDSRVTGHMDGAALAAALDPASYLGSAGLFIDRVLDRYQRLVGI